jgi:SOS response regulatory protein OraA/RecX
MLKVLSVRSKGKLKRVLFSGNLELLLDKDICIKYNLIRNTEIPSGKLSSIKEESIRSQAERYASYLLARQEYSGGLLRKKLLARGYEPKLAGNIISRLKKSGHIDDERYARRKAESILKRKPAGHRYLVACLRAENRRRIIEWIY